MYTLRKKIILLFGVLFIAGCGLPGAPKASVPDTTVTMTGVKKVFEVAEQNFAFSYPAEWRYEPSPSAADFTSGSFVLNGEEQLYVEAPYVGHGFIFYTRDDVPYYLENPVIATLPRPMFFKFSKTFATMDEYTPVTMSVYRPCEALDSTKKCTPAATGGFVVAYFERNTKAPVLSSEAAGSDHDVFVLYRKLPDDAVADSQALSMFETIVKSIKFTDHPIQIPVDTPEQPVTIEEPTVQIYTNKKYRYTIGYSSDFSVVENANLSNWSLNPGTQFILPPVVSEGTNLRSAKIVIGTVTTDDAESVCLVPELNTEVGTVTIDGEEFTKSQGVDAVEGIYDDNVTYATFHNNMCYHITLVMHASTLATVNTDKPVKEFERGKIVALFDGIMQSFRFLEN